MSVYAQLQGPLSYEVYDSLQKMARIMYLQGDISIAIELQTKAISVSIEIYGGIDNT